MIKFPNPKLLSDPVTFSTKNRKSSLIRKGGIPLHDYLSFLLLFLFFSDRGKILTSPILISFYQNEMHGKMALIVLKAEK